MCGREAENPEMNTGVQCSDYFFNSGRHFLSRINSRVARWRSFLIWDKSGDKLVGYSFIPSFLVFHSCLSYNNFFKNVYICLFRNKANLSDLFVGERIENILLYWLEFVRFFTGKKA